MSAIATKFSKPVISSPPDFENLLLVLERKVPKRPTLFEFFLNQPLYEKLAGAKQPEGGMDITRLRWLLKAFGNAGYDYATFHGSNIHFPRGDNGVGGFRMAGGTMITDRKTFDAYAWPKPDDFDYSPLAEIKGELPEGMKLVVCGPGGVLENAVALVGFENLCFLVADEPEFVDDIFARIGQVLVRHYEIVAEHDTVGACISNDDWGFKTQPMLSPDNMRRFVIPWHKKIADTIHKAGKPAILHSCGNQAELYDEIIDNIGYDGKHSYEDEIQPIEDAYEELHAHIALLGGIDLDFVCRSAPRDVYARSLAMLERASSRGGFALGTGNSVPEYVPDENYFAMIAAAVEGRK